jgi:hypothetical protein
MNDGKDDEQEHPDMRIGTTHLIEALIAATLRELAQYRRERALQRPPKSL